MRLPLIFGPITICEFCFLIDSDTFTLIRHKLNIMQKQRLIYRLAAYAVFFFSACSNSGSQSFTVTNQLDIPREAEIITLHAEDLLSFIDQDNIENVFIRQEGNKGYLRSQYVDTNLDGDIDEILFQASIGPGATETFHIETPADAPVAKQDSLTTFSRFVPERFNDYAWENDRIAFRVYGLQDTTETGPRPSGGGIDAFMKRVSYPIIDRWYKNNAESEGAYHIDTGEGHDPYLIGSSRGLGGSGIWDNDSLYVSSSFLKHKTIAEGPLRTIFELSYAPWDANGRNIKETKRISLDLGSHLSRIEETIETEQSIPNLVAGISLRDKKGEVKGNEEEGWFRYWEPLDDSWLGSAIVINPADLSEFRDHRTDVSDQSHLYVFGKPVNNKFTYFSGYGWVKSGHFKTVEEWDAYLSHFSKKLASPLVPKFEN